MNAIDEDTCIATELLLFQDKLASDWVRHSKLVRSSCVYNLIEGIHDKIFDPELRIDGLLRDLGLCPSHAYEAFKATEGVAPHEYLEGLRILAAMRLLVDPELSMTSIGFAVGYSNYRTFARAFSRLVRMCPREYREHVVAEVLQRNSGQAAFELMEN